MRDSWLEQRHELGRTQDRERALYIFQQAIGYKPLKVQAKLHLAAYPDRIDKFFYAGIS